MGSVLPYFQRLQKEGEAGRKKITQITRYGTVFIAAMQSYGVTVFLEKELQVVINPGALFVFTAIVSMVTGTILLMWMGERVTERGIGNGISLIIMVGIYLDCHLSLVMKFVQLLQEKKYLYLN